MKEPTAAMFDGTGLKILGDPKRIAHPIQPPSVQYEVLLGQGQVVDFNALDAHLATVAPGFVTNHKSFRTLKDQDGEYACVFIIMWFGDHFIRREE